MVTSLKSLCETTVYHGEQGRSLEERYCLLGLNEDDRLDILKTAGDADELCQARRFRKAFEALTLIRPQLCGEKRPVSKQMSPDELKAMALRRLQKRQRQRQ